MIVKFKRLDDRATLPKYQTSGASGFDFHTLEEVVIFPGETRVIKTGLAVELPTCGPVFYELQVRPRGGTSLKTSLRIANSPGTVDVDYRGEVGIVAWNSGDDDLVFKAGERIAQGVICPVIQCRIEEVEKINITARGTGAYNSTGER
jgi:dUTP pyrophosphatase